MDKMYFIIEDIFLNKSDECASNKLAEKKSVVKYRRSSENHSSL